MEELHGRGDPVMVGIWVSAFAVLRSRGYVVHPPQIPKLPQAPLPIPSEAVRDIETVQNCGFKSAGKRLQEMDVCQVGKLKDIQINQIAARQAR
ncbi:hypothetical protein HB771_22315 [Rhizobium leguminosarum bv. viciae]|nr:hypothetical protein HB771_22315 [Rhizobium leguminosarum bv. viciae]